MHTRGSGSAASKGQQIARAALAGLGILWLGCQPAQPPKLQELPLARQPGEAPRNPAVVEAMQRLRRQSDQLGAVLFGSSLPGPFERPVVVEILADMDRTTAELERAGGPSEHPLLRAHLADFRREIRYAREGLKREPPDFLQVAIVQGACVLCHERQPPAATRSQ